jgi:uncharacterized phage protein (TIGR02218 family)
MKTATNAFIQFLAANTQFVMAELYDLTLADGTHLHYTTFDRSLKVSGTTYLSGPPNFKRGTVDEVIGLSKIGTLSLELHANPTDLIGGVPILQKIARGDLDKAQITVRRLFMSAAADGLTQQGTVIRFVGNIGDLDELSRTTAKFTCKSKVEELNIQLPRNILQPTCIHTLFDAGCTLSKAAFAVNGTVQVGSTVNKLLTTLSQADSYFDNGQLVLTSGANTGHVVAVRKYLNAAGTVLFVVPLPAVPTAGDTFTIYPGCDKTQATCSGKFSNLVNFGGFPYVPVPETAI